LFRKIKPASSLPKGANYRVFKDGIEPAWEDVKNARGGAWVVKVSNKSGGNKNAAAAGSNKTNEWLDQSWMYLLLECIGEGFGDDSEEICGIVASVRATECRIALWTSTAADTDAVQRVGCACYVVFFFFSVLFFLIFLFLLFYSKPCTACSLTNPLIAWCALQ
jgi:translation initiation factor 4E